MVSLGTAAAWQAQASIDRLDWDLRGVGSWQQAEALVQDVAACLPFYLPGRGLLLLDWSAQSSGDTDLRVCPQISLHASPWLHLPVAALRPTGAWIEIDEDGNDRQLFMRMPARGGRAGVRAPLATGLLRMSMQAHGAQRRFLPVVTREDLVQDSRGLPALHLHSLDLALLQAGGYIPAARAKELAGIVGERVLMLMSLPGAGHAHPVGVTDEVIDFA